MGRIVFGVVPWFITQFWIWLQCDLWTFVTTLLAVLLSVPYFTWILPFWWAKGFSVCWFVVSVWFAKDMSAHVLTETLIANTAYHRARMTWRRVSTRAYRRTFMRRMAIFGVGLSIVAYLMKASRLSFNGHSLEPNTVEEERRGMQEKSMWSIFRGVMGNSAGGKTVNMTTLNLINRVKENQVSIYTHDHIGDSNNSLRTNGFFACKGYLILPLHWFNRLKDQAKCRIVRGNKEECVVIDTTEHDTERQWLTFGNDMVIVRLTGVNHARDIV